MDKKVKCATLMTLGTIKTEEVREDERKIMVTLFHPADGIGISKAS